MTKQVYVTKTQQAAAKMIVERNTANGKAVRSSVSKIANASSGSNGRSAVLPRGGLGIKSRNTGAH
jgi:predicted DNA-binding protein (UPF0251 family)